MSFKTKALGSALAVSLGVSGFMFSQRSTENLQDVHRDLRKLTACALDRTTVDFVVVDGRRTMREHLINVSNGRSWVKRSRHVDGLAIDFAAYVGGKITYNSPPYYKISKAFYSCSESLDIPITWGGEWRVRDLMHIELHKSRYKQGI